jgi:steroid delta-isomerase-like uncharacterized protein
VAAHTTPPADRVPRPTDAEATANAYVAVWNDRDYGAIPHLVSETFVMYDPAAPAKGVAGPKGEVHGRDGLRQFMELITTAFPDFEITVLEMLANDGSAIYEVRLTMTHDGPLGGLPPTGQRVDVRGVSILHVEAGVVDEHRFYTDTSDVTEQLGLTFPGVITRAPSLLVGKLRTYL